MQERVQTAYEKKQPHKQHVISLVILAFARTVCDPRKSNAGWMHLHPLLCCQLNKSQESYGLFTHLLFLLKLVCFMWSILVLALLTKKALCDSH